MVWSNCSFLAGESLLHCVQELPSLCNISAQRPRLTPSAWNMKDYKDSLDLALKSVRLSFESQFTTSYFHLTLFTKDLFCAKHGSKCSE